MPADGLAGQSLAQGPHEQRNDGRFLISASLFMSAVVGCGTCIRIIEQHTRLSPLLVAIPFFMLLMIIELVILKTCRIRSAAAQYTISGIINSVCAGVVQQIGGMAMKRVGLHLLSYGWFHQRYCVAYFFPMTGKYLGPPLSVLAVDLCYYFAHRLGHQLGFIWAGHHVHHNSDEYNLSTALKQSWLSQVFTRFVYLPLSLFMAHSRFVRLMEWNLIYQFWVHTCCIRRLSVLELFLTTPSNHRVHHDRRYHKNFGGIFCVWDRIFGTFMDEASLACVGSAEKLASKRGQSLLMLGVDGDELAYFGTTAPQVSYVEDLLQLQQPKHLLRKVACTSGLFNKITCLWPGPGYYTAVDWENKSIPRPTQLPSRRIRMRSVLRNTSGKLYVALHFVAALVMFAECLASQPTLASVQLCVALMPMALGLLSIACTLDGMAKAAMVEIIRCMGMFVICLRVVRWARMQETAVPKAYFGTLFYMVSTMFLLGYRHALEVSPTDSIHPCRWARVSKDKRA